MGLLFSEQTSAVSVGEKAAAIVTLWQFRYKMKLVSSHAKDSGRRLPKSGPNQEIVHIVLRCMLF